MMAAMIVFVNTTLRAQVLTKSPAQSRIVLVMDVGLASVVHARVRIISSVLHRPPQRDSELCRLISSEVEGTEKGGKRVEN